jgi:hypothetical protein
MESEKRGASTSRAVDLALDHAAEAAARAVRKAGSGRACERFLLRFADHLGSQEPEVPRGTLGALPLLDPEFDAIPPALRWKPGTKN